MKFNQRIMKMIGKVKVQRQLYNIFFLTLSIPILLIGSSLLLSTKNLLLEQYQTQLHSENLRVRSIMHSITTSIYHTSTDIINDSNLINLIMNAHTSEREVSNAFQEYVRQSNRNNIASIASITIYTTNPTIYNVNNTTYAINLSKTENVTQEAWYQRALSQFSAFWISLPSVDSGGNEFYELALIRQIPLHNSPDTAVLCIRVSGNHLRNQIQNSHLLITTSINQDPVFFSTNRTLQDKSLPFFIDYEKGFYHYNDVVEFNNTNVLGNISTLRPYLTDDYLYISVLNLDAYSNIKKIFLLCIGIIFIASLLAIGLIFLFTKYFSARIHALRNAMHMANKGHYFLKDSFYGDDELSETFHDLHQMILKIKEKDAKMYREKIDKQKLKTEQQKMEFKMLASQINPHFLYNTLETIRMQALAAGNKETATSIKLLGKSMHYVLENTGTVFTTLKKELDYIQTYLAIQKLRFGDRVNYTLKVASDMNLENYQILPLLLQPIVENAIFHGLEGIEENGQITIDIQSEDNNYLKITVSDNGIGMSPEKLHCLRERILHIDASTTSSIALYNISRRILLCYGPDYHIKISSILGEGTKVILHLPLNKNSMKEN